MTPHDVHKSHLHVSLFDPRKDEHPLHLSTNSITLATMITGVEIAGLAMAACPLLIEGVRIYSEGIGVMKNMRRESYRKTVQKYDREIRVSVCLYEQACKKVLSSVMAKEALKSLLEDPNPVVWASPNVRSALRMRLEDDRAVLFERTASQFVATSEELRVLLDIEPYMACMFLLISRTVKLIRYN